MIARRFGAVTTPTNAPHYYAYFRDKLAPELSKIPGHRGALVLSRELTESIAITVVTFWESMEAIRAFAGDSPNRAVVEPEGRAWLSSFDDEVTHNAVEVDTIGNFLA
jgi:heme-degrading monooxygenase HmoA